MENIVKHRQAQKKRIKENVNMEVENFVEKLWRKKEIVRIKHIRTSTEQNVTILGLHGTHNNKKNNLEEGKSQQGKKKTLQTLKKGKGNDAGHQKQRNYYLEDKTGIDTKR